MVSRGIVRAGNITKELMKSLKSTECFERTMKHVNIIRCGDGKCEAEFKVALEHQNMGGTLHGGFTATLVDCISTYALMTSKRQAPGVSVDMHIKYLKAAFEDDVVVIEANTVKAGKTLAFLDVILKNKETGDIIATGSHTKFVGGQ